MNGGEKERGRKDCCFQSALVHLVYYSTQLLLNVLIHLLFNCQISSTQPWIVCYVCVCVGHDWGSYWTDQLLCLQKLKKFLKTAIPANIIISVNERGGNSLPKRTSEILGWNWLLFYLIYNFYYSAHEKSSPVLHLGITKSSWGHIAGALWDVSGGGGKNCSVDCDWLLVPGPSLLNQPMVRGYRVNTVMIVTMEKTERM